MHDRYNRVQTTENLKIKSITHSKLLPGTNVKRECFDLFCEQALENLLASTR
jgi:hypothetical protein